MGSLANDSVDSISSNMQSEIFTTLLVFLTSANREIVKSVLGFVKLAVHTMPPELLRPHLKDLVPALLKWSHDHKNHFKAKVQHIFERMIRRFGYDEIIAHADKEDGKKVLQNIKKRKDRAKRKRAAAENAEGDESDEVRCSCFNRVFACSHSRRLRLAHLGGQATRSRMYSTEVKVRPTTATTRARS